MTHSRYTIAAFALLLLLCLAAQVCAAGKVTETKLPNGLTILMKEVHAAPVFTAQLWFKVGSRNEHVGITGISHMLEHMLFSSSKNFKKGEITRQVRERGGIDNAATSYDFTYYWVLLSRDNLEFAIRSMAERAGNALLLPEEFAKERGVVISELQGRENDPDTLLYQAQAANAYVAHPYQVPVIGWLPDLQKIDRNQLKDYYDTYYHPNNATLVLVGDFDSDKALAYIKKYFGSILPGKGFRGVYTTEPKQYGQRSFAIRREGSAERIMLSWHIPAIAHPDIYPLTVLDQVLSGGRASRLYQALVEKQLAVGVWSNCDSRKDPGLFTLGATARTGVSADTLKTALLEEVRKVRKASVTAQEIATAKNQIEAYFLYQNDSVSDQGEQLGYYATIDTYKTLDTYLARIKAVQDTDIQRVAEKYLVDDGLTAGSFIPTAKAPEGGAPGGPPPAEVHHETTGAYLRKEIGGDLRMATYNHHPGYLQRMSKGLPLLYYQNGSNGKQKNLVLLVKENHANPTVAISGSIKAGSVFDVQGKTGVAELVAQMLQRGTSKRTALQFASETEFLGAHIAARARVEALDFSARSLSRDLEKVLDLLSDALRNPIFPDDQVERAKGQMLSALEQSNESPDDQAFRQFYKTLFPPNHPYATLSVADEQNEVKSITRDDLLAFHRTYYRPDTTIIAVVGDVQSKKVVELVEKYFGDWQNVGPTPEVTIPTVEKPTKPVFISEPMPGKSEVSVVYGTAPSLTRKSSDYYAFRVMNQIIGGSGALGSVLGQQIREKQGLVYSVYSSYDVGLGAGPWFAQLGTGPDNVNKAIAALRSEIEKFRKNGATKEQFEQARKFIIGVFPIALETNSGIANAMVSAEFYGLGPEYLRDYAKYYQAVTLEQVNAAAKKYLPDHNSAALVVVGGNTPAKIPAPGAAPPKPTAAKPTPRPAVPIPAPRPATAAVRLSVTAKNAVWVSITVDGKRKFAGIMPAGKEMVWEAKREIRIRVARRGAVVMLLDGKPFTFTGNPATTVNKIFRADK